MRCRGRGCRPPDARGVARTCVRCNHGSCKGIVATRYKQGQLRATRSVANGDGHGVVVPHRNPPTHPGQFAVYPESESLTEGELRLGTRSTMERCTG